MAFVLSCQLGIHRSKRYRAILDGWAVRDSEVDNGGLCAIELLIWNIINSTAGSRQSESLLKLGTKQLPVWPGKFTLSYAQSKLDLYRYCPKYISPFDAIGFIFLLIEPYLRVNVH